MTTRPYPDLRANPTQATAIEHAKALAWHHMHGQDTDELVSISALWAKARTGISYVDYTGAYFTECINLGWDGVPGSNVGVRSLVEA